MVSLRTLYWRLLVLLLLLNVRAAADGIEAAGNVLQYAMPASAAALPLTHRDWEGTWEFAASVAVQGVTVLVLKNSVYETRPNGQGHQSFPSGHAAVTFASAEFLRERYGWYYGAPAYALASFTAYSRVESQNHYWHDVIAGANSSVPALSGVPLTHRDLASMVTIVTGHESALKDSEVLDWSNLARLGGTIVIMMGMSNLAKNMERLVAGGMDARMPVTVIEKGSTPEQRTVSSDITYTYTFLLD